MSNNSKKQNNQKKNNNSNKNNVKNNKVSANKSNVKNNNKVNTNNSSVDNKKTKSNKNNQNNQKSLDKTGTIDLVFDDERLDKTDLLDISFLEKASKNKDKKASDNKKEKEEIEILSEEDEKLFKKDSNVNSNKFIMLLIIFVAFILGFIVCNLFTETKVETKIKVEKEEIIKNDENIVFVGDSLFDFYDVEKYFEGRHVVNSGISGDITTDILDNMEERVYRYNPSTIFLLIGTNDLVNPASSKEKVALNIEKIIKEIKENRPYTKINVLSLLPVNKSDNEKINLDAVQGRRNSDINEINKDLKIICDENDVSYIDMHSLFSDEDGKFKLDYTTEGLHISDEGYKVMTEEIMKYINDENLDN